MTAGGGGWPQCRLPPTPSRPLSQVIQGLLIGRLSRHFSEGALLRASVLVFSLVGLAMVLMSNVFHFCLLMPALLFSLCILTVVTDSMLTKAVPASDTGECRGGGWRGPGLGRPRRSSLESLIWVG